MLCLQGRLKVAAQATAGAMVFLLLGTGAQYPALGRALEGLLCMAGLYFVLRAPRLTAGVLAEERRNQTLGLLFLSGLGAGEVFASKFLSSALIAFTNLLAIFLCGWTRTPSSGWPDGTASRRRWAGWWWAGSRWSGCCSGRPGPRGGPACRTFSSPPRCSTPCWHGSRGRPPPRRSARGGGTALTSCF